MKKIIIILALLITVPAFAGECDPNEDKAGAKLLAMNLKEYPVRLVLKVVMDEFVACKFEKGAMIPRICLEEKSNYSDKCDHLDDLERL